MRLYRPVGQKEFELIKESGFTKFPPRLPEQPIFYPVLNIKYARYIASNWNTQDKNSGYVGYVLTFEMNDKFIANYEIQTVGDNFHQEFWIPAQNLEEFNNNIVDEIQVIEKYTKFQKLDKVYNMPIFETERLILRPIDIKDANDVHEYASDFENTKYMIFNTHKDIEVTKAYLQLMSNKYSKSECFDYAIVLKENNKVIGAGGAFNINTLPHKLEIGYILNKKYWGKGIIVEAMNELISFFFDVLDVHKIEAVHFAPNANSGKAMQKIGMIYEGESIDAIYIRNQYFNKVMYGLINPNHKKR